MSHLAAVMATVLLTVSATVSGATPLEHGRTLAEQGDAARGIVACAGCHRADGGGDEALGAARLAGLEPAYLATQIERFRAGQRSHPVMSPWAERLEPADITAVSAYYGALAPASNARAPSDVDAVAGRALAETGDWSGRDLPACVRCHGPGGTGAGTVFPPLAGQPYSYLLAQLEAWASGRRHGEPMALMGAVAGRLDADEQRALAAYFATRPLAVADPVDDLPDPAPAPAPVTASASTPATAVAGADAAVPEHLGSVPAGRAEAASRFTPPGRDALPEGPFGEMVRLGARLFRHTNTDPRSASHVGNDQTCAGCHLDNGRRADASPMWAAWVAYPAYRGKNQRVDTMAERIQGCFRYSMNAQDSASGQVPETNSVVIDALQTYIYWLATGAPTGDTAMSGRGYPRLQPPAEGFDRTRGAALYAEHCALCHGAEGEGLLVEGEVVFPPLWGPRSYNWGAGMHRVDTAAAFIAANMPLLDTVRLTPQEAWDVAAYINAHERPQDPRFDGSVERTAARFHTSPFDLYGEPLGDGGAVLGQGTTAD
ncbi:c-type cytochrome [Marichromatium gracile]|uniref:Thiosulfate dehydrogenase n=1 Tax=Marichromatium gracile TaxID=1048 RepID=A0A4R4ADS5_MARGR|nr:c-type cytochrome [Marichromatium gracile]MBK1709229.1 cytochrome C [Marichromatium gracile]TCW37125.1 thiosulfate dehydrogenase [Marichromatium gracile]